MADLPEHPSEEREGSEGDRDRVWLKERLLNLGISEAKFREKINDIVWEQILFPWYHDHPTDRHVSPLFLRSDTVLHDLADRIITALAQAREGVMAEQKLNPEQQAKLDKWVRDQDAIVLMAQKALASTRKHPYFGAIGGSLTFETTMTSLGGVIKVWYCKGTSYEAVLDLTPYEDW
jgi:hypothetical protein